VLPQEFVLAMLDDTAVYHIAACLEAGASWQAPVDF
jgi:hypothetical protein